MKMKGKEKSSIKSLVGTALLALLFVTILLVGGTEKLVASGTEINVPTENVLVVNEPTAQKISDELSKMPQYTNGMVINVTENLNLGSLKVETSVIPTDIYFVFKGEQVGEGEQVGIYNCSQLNNIANMIEGNEAGLNVYFCGSGSIYAGAIPETDIPFIEDWKVCNRNMGVKVSSDVDTSFVRFCFGQGSSSLELLGENKIIENTVGSGYDQVFYCAQEGLYKSKMDDMSIQVEEISVEEISEDMITDNLFDPSVFARLSGGDARVKVVYTQSAVDSLPAGTKLTYENYNYVGTYNVPSEAFIIDTRSNWGIYSTNKDSLKVYALGTEFRFTELETTNDGSSDSPRPVRIDINALYFKDENQGEYYKNVNFSEGSIPSTYKTDPDGAGSASETVYEIQQIRMAETIMTGTEEVIYTFDMNNRADIEIWNPSDVAIEIEDKDAGANNTVWVSFDVDYVTGCTMEGLERKADGVDDGFYEKAGATITLSAEKQTIYNIQLGTWEIGATENTYSYETGRRAGMDHITFCTNGDVQVKVPNFGSRLDVTVGDIVTVDESNVSNYITVDSSSAMGTNNWYISDVTLVPAENHSVCDASIGAANADGWMKDGIVFSEEGEKTKSLYVMDMTMEVNAETGEQTPSGTYGKISALSYSYAMDKSAPTLLFTDANNQTQSLLKSDSEYEGNLYLTYEESGSGFSEINLYKKEGTEETKNNDLLIATEEGYYIAQTAQNEIYKLEIADKAGNIAVYDNITVLAIVTENQKETVPEKPETEEVPITESVFEELLEEVVEEEIIPLRISIGRAHLDSGAPYEFGEGTWKVTGDSTNYSGGITFYVLESGDYEFTQEVEEEEE